MITVSHQLFSGNPTWPRFEAAHFDSCRFDNCLLAAPDDPARRRSVAAVRLTGCVQHSCWIEGAIITDVSVSALSSGGDMPLFLNGCVFNHVTLSGRITALKINRSVRPGAPPQIQAGWDAANKDFYRSVDWALDITAAAFTSVPTFEAVPGSLIRRDPETQVLIARRLLAAESLAGIDFGSTSYDIAISWFLATSPYDDCVLVAARKNRKFKEQLRVLTALRQRGLAS